MSTSFGKGIISSIQRIDAFILRRQLRNGQDHKTCQFILYFLFGMVCGGLVNTWYMGLRFPAIASLFLIPPACAFALMVIFILGLKPRVATEILLLLLFGSIFVYGVMGRDQSSVVWIVTIPMIATLAKDSASGHRWLCTMAVLILAILVAGLAEPATLRYVPSAIAITFPLSLLNIALFVLLFFFIAYFFKKGWGRQLAEIEGKAALLEAEIARRDDVEKEVEELGRIRIGLLDAVPIPVFVKDGELVYTECNKAFLDFTGLPREAVIGKRVDEVFEPAYAATYNEADQELVQSMSPQKYESKLRYADGSYHDVLFSKTILRAGNGEFRGIIGAISDLDDRVRMEKKLLSLVETKDRLLSVISHDLVNPIWGFKQVLGMALEDEGRYDAETRELFHELKRSMDFLYETLDNLLHWARIQGGFIAFSPGALELGPVVESVRGGFESMASMKGVVVELEAGRGLRAVADERLFRMIIRNLLSNAIKFSPRGRPIRIRLGREGDWGKVEVADEGPGIGADQIEDLFQGRPVQSTVGTENEKGHGLGLAICAELAKLHGGRLAIRSEAGKGSTFSLYLPLA